MDWETNIGQSRLTSAIQAEEFNMVALLRPKIYPDGNMWCVLYGDNLQEGVCGFGDTPYRAVLTFNKAWNDPLSKTETRGAEHG